jgi:tetratricopeptide (TPR) repeat protein
MAAAGLGWLLTPLEGKIRAISIPLTRPIVLGVHANSHFRVDSLGAVLIGLGLLGLIFVLLRAHRRFLFYLGGAVAIVCFAFVFKVVFHDATIIESLLDQRNQEQNIKTFSRNYLDGVATFLHPEKELNTDSLLDRVMTIWIFLGFGWLAALSSGALLLVATYRGRGRPLKWDAALVLLLLIGSTAFLTAKSVTAERHRERADRHLSHGRYQAAIGEYEEARDLDPTLASNLSYTYNLGAANYALGRMDRPEALVYLGDNLLSVKDHEKAEAAYETAAELGADPGMILRKRVLSRVKDGLGHYAQGEVMDAITSWRRGLELDPGQIQAHFFLTKAYLDMHDRNQSLAISEGQKLLSILQEKLTRGDLYVLLGHAYYKQREYAAAREMFALSNAQFQMVKKLINFEAMKGLQGI